MPIVYPTHFVLARLQCMTMWRFPLLLIYNDDSTSCGWQCTVDLRKDLHCIDVDLPRGYGNRITPRNSHSYGLVDETLLSTFTVIVIVEGCLWPADNAVTRTERDQNSRIAAAQDREAKGVAKLVTSLEYIFGAVRWYTSKYDIR